MLGNAGFSNSFGGQRTSKSDDDALSGGVSMYAGNVGMRLLR